MFVNNLYVYDMCYGYRGVIVYLWDSEIDMLLIWDVILNKFKDVKEFGFLLVGVVI